jgi:serine-type D-Ala-D-Ala carboxypeptidase (penicillin-binding protein 5/6)
VAAGLAAATVASVLSGVAALGAGGPPPTPVPPSGSLSPFPTILHTPSPAAPTAPKLRARAALLGTAATGQVLFAKQPDRRQPIASVTKLMTALVTVSNRSLDHVVTVAADATGQTGSILGLVAGERVTVRNLLYALLLQSANDAAVALADDVGGSSSAFVEMMNAKAARLGMRDTNFRSPNGLDDRGYSTAADVADLTRAVLDRAALRTVMAAKVHTIPNADGPARVVQNRDALLWLYPGAIAGKTGFTTAAGFCLVAAAQRSGRQLVAVVLGDPSDITFDEAATLLNYGFDAFQPRTVVHRGDAAGSIQVGGAQVEAASNATLVRLVRSDRVGEVRLTLDPAESLTLPIAEGAPIGRVVVLAHGAVLGAVRAVAVKAVAAPPPPPDLRPPPAPAAGGSIALLADLLLATFGAPP